MGNQAHTQRSIERLLLTSDKAVERAIVALYRRQEEDERASEHTTHRNGRGFSVAHAKVASYCARWILSGKRLSGHWLRDCRVIALYYSRQLSEIAKIRQAHRAANAA